MPSSPPYTDGIRLLWWAAHHPPADPETSFSGKTILITGGNVGLGFEAALKFAKLQASQLVLGVRSLHHGQEAKSEISRRTGYDFDRIHLYEIDMSTFSSVKEFVKSISEKELSIDVVVLNAGITAPSYRLSQEGYEMTLQVNVISTALLAILLLPQLHNSARVSGKPAHLEFVGSLAHRALKSSSFNCPGGTKFLDYVNSPEFFNWQTHYHVSKLLLMWVMDGLVQMSSITNHANSDVIISTVCPGLCRTNLGREFSSPLKIVNGLFQNIFARTAEEGSRTIVSGTTLGADSHGEIWSHDVYFAKGELVTTENGKALQRQFWSEIINVLKEHVPSDNKFFIVDDISTAHY